jgi:hypothetical protein
MAMTDDERLAYMVEVEDPPHHPLERPMHFRLGPFASRAEAERIAARARDTETGSHTRIVTVGEGFDS